MAGVARVGSTPGSITAASRSWAISHMSLRGVVKGLFFFQIADFRYISMQFSLKWH